MPNDKIKYYEDLLFDYETSYRTQYRGGDIQPLVKTVYKAKPKCYRTRPAPLRDIHTLVDWKDSRIPPFNLFHKPKDIVRINPWDVQQPYENPDMEASREKVQKTRPRLVMTPAVSMDDIDEPATRRILCGETYCSAASRAMRETAALRPARANVKAPLPGLPAPANPITLPKLQPPFVSPEWRMETASWDARQLRAHCDHTKSFWLGQAPMRCQMCDETAIVQAHRKMLRDLKYSGR